MSTVIWPGSELRCAVDRQRTAVRQVAALAVVAAGGAAWSGLTAMHTPPLVPLATAIAVLALLPLAAWALLSREDMARAADELILNGYEPAGRSDEVAAAVRRRREHLLGKGLEALVVQLRFQAGLRSPRRAPFRAPVARYPQALERIADLLEQGSADPRAVILLERLVSEPAPETIGRMRTGRSLEERLHEVMALLEVDAALAA